MGHSLPAGVATPRALPGQLAKVGSQLFQRRFLTGLAITLLAAQACGSDDGKKKVSASDAGMGGEATAPGPDSGGSAAGAPLGEPPAAGGVGGAAEPPIEATAGAGGEPNPVVLPEPELLFSVKAGANGLPNTELRAATTKENFIYASKTQSQAATAGSNAVKISGVDMGLDATDQIVSFALLQAEPKNPNYLFSVADGSEGASPTRVFQAYWDDPDTEEGKVYYSAGVQSVRNIGEGGDDYGYNALAASELSLGLSPGEGENRPDDLAGLAVHDANAPITELYFTVSPNAIGATDSAVSTVPPEERACTVFKTTLDGNNSVAFGCTALGLLTESDEIDALAVYGTSAPTKVVFSVSVGSQGALGSTVEATQAAGSVGATLFSSPGDGSNAVLKTDRDLGLGQYVDDELDGLAVVDAAPKASVTHAASCSLAYDPRDAAAGGGLTYIQGTARVGQNVMVLYGQTAAQQNRLLAYNATTCAFLQQKDLPAGFENLTATAIVPLAGWSTAKPLDKVEYLRGANDQAYAKELQRYDADGMLVKAFPIANTDYTDGVAALVYEPAGQRLYLLMNNSHYGYPRMWFAVIPRPAIDAEVATLEPTFGYLSAPCADEVALTGTDADGNLYVGRRQTAVTDYLVCGFTPYGELLPAPYSWSSNGATDDRGFIVPGGSSFLLRSTNISPIVIERGAYKSP